GVRKLSTTLCRCTFTKRLGNLNFANNTAIKIKMQVKMFLVDFIFIIFNLRNNELKSSDEGLAEKQLGILSCFPEFTSGLSMNLFTSP
ncbi:MAG: hypothetical protein ACE5HX_14815, partial [bacterium]